jgi:hypothetical protein
LVTCALLAPPEAAQRVPAITPVIARVVARNDPPPEQFRALRRLQAKSEHFAASAWMEAWTEVDPETGFSFKIIGEGGSGYVRSHVLRPWLEREDKMWAAGDPGRAALTFANYDFVDRGPTDDGLEWLEVKSKRKDVLLVNGSIFVNPDDGDLVRIEGRLSKSPSFWTRRVEVVRHYERVNGVRVPTAIETVAQVLIAGRSTFSMKYEYETINGTRVGNPQPGGHPAR